jgi:hypothetical protein
MLDKTTNRLLTQYNKVIFYTYTPLAVGGLLRGNHIKPETYFNLKTKRPENQALKFYCRPKPSRFYVVRMRNPSEK